MPRKKTDVKAPQKGVPPKVINWDEVDKLLQAHCLGTEIAAYIKVTEDTLYERCKREKGMLFSAYSQSIKGVGKAMLRNAQMDLAMERDRGMLIHLGEHVLEQGKQKEVAPPNEDATATRHALMMALAQIDKLTAELNAYKPETKQELCGSDTSIQHMGGCCP